WRTRKSPMAGAARAATMASRLTAIMSSMRVKPRLACMADPDWKNRGAVSASPRRVAIGVLMAGVKSWANGRSKARNCRRARKSAIRPLVFSPSAQRARLPEPLPAHAALHADHQLAVTVQRCPVADGEGAVADVAHAPPVEVQAGFAAVPVDAQLPGDGQAVQQLLARIQGAVAVAVHEAGQRSNPQAHAGVLLVQG